MAQPTPYTPTTDFSQQEANNAAGRSTVNTAALDAEFAAIDTTLDQTLTNLALLQRDDGRLQDLACEVHTLSPEVMNLMGGFRITGIWQAATAYSINDLASNGEYQYVCITAHTSGGSFDEQYWKQYGFSGGSDAAQSAAAAAVSATNAHNSELAAAASAAAASGSASAASTSAGSASSSATTATTQASSAATSATNAANSAAAAAASAASITYPIPVASGGTGAVDATAARSNLGITPANIGAQPAGSYLSAADIHAATSKTTPVDADELALVDSAASFALKKITFAQLQTALGASGAPEEALAHFIRPSLDGGYRDLYRSGWLPAWFNQQWGGAQWGELPDGSFGSIATGYIEDNNSLNLGAGAAGYYNSQGFKVAETATFDAVWVKLYKVGNPAGNLTARIYSDSAGSPNAAIGSAAAISCKLLSSKTDGAWVQITGLAAALTAGTQYHLVLTLSTTDASNYVSWKQATAKKYPHGHRNIGTSVPAWTPDTTQAQCFLVQNPAANALLQSGGVFDYKLSFVSGLPVNQSRAVAQPLVNFYDGKNGTVHYVGTFAANTTVFDFAYGIDHDRITLTINGSGYPVLTLYEADRTVATVTGTVSVTSGTHALGIRYRTVGDGADYLTGYQDGATFGAPLTAQTFTMSNEFRQLGTARLGDGFGLAPTWTQDMQMTSLPSAQSWTFTGTATEGNAFSIQNNKLYQNANGYTSAQTGYYTRTVAFNNATGWCVTWKMQIRQATNTSGEQACAVVVQDGTKRIDIGINEHYVQSKMTSTVDFTVQGDFKSQERVFALHGKGSDYYLFIDGKLAIDGTGKLTSATGTNSIIFGDLSNTASENADAIWSYLKYYQGGMLLPTAGANTCSEFAHWSGDKSALFPTLWNAGTPKSVKEVCGAPRNYQFEAVVQREVRRGVTSSPTTSSSTATQLADLEAYILGGDVSVSHTNTQYNATSGVAGYNTAYVDGTSLGNTVYAQSSGANYGVALSGKGRARSLPTTLRKCEIRWYTDSSTETSYLTTRTAEFEARS